jgi:hypothetical protein
MRTIAVVLVVFSIAVAVAILQGSGFAAVWGGETPQSQVAQEQLDEAATEVNPNNQPVEGPVNSGDSSLTGIIVDGIGGIVNIAGAVATLPSTLANLGFPVWFAAPVGSLAVIITGIGVVQFATGRDYV